MCVDLIKMFGYFLEPDMAQNITTDIEVQIANDYHVSV